MAKGFTMIELLIVLVILGLASALVMPKFPAVYERFKGKSEEEKLFQTISLLGLKAYTKQSEIVLSEQSYQELLDLPDSWTISIPKPIVYRANGFCLGGEIKLSVNGVARHLTLLPPYCAASAESSKEKFTESGNE